MESNRKYLAAITVFIALITWAEHHSVFGQKFEVGIFGGTSYYMGDLNPEPTNQFVNSQLPALGVFGRYNMNEHLSLRLGANYGTVTGNDAESEYDILDGGDIYHFETDIAEIALKFDINFLPFVAGDPNSLYTPYVFGGISGFYFNPVAKRESGGEITEITDDTHWHPDKDSPPSFDNISTAINFGMGLKYHITRNITGGIEWGMRYTATDYIDEVSMQGNPKNNDWYSFAGISFTLRFKDRSGAICPPNFL